MQVECYLRQDPIVILFPKCILSKVIQKISLNRRTHNLQRKERAYETLLILKQYGTERKILLRTLLTVGGLLVMNGNSPCEL